MLHSDERPLSKEVTDLLGEIQRLFRLEAELVRRELSPRMSRFGRHAAVMAIGGIMAGIGLLAFLISAIIGLAGIVPPWLAVLIAGLVFTAGGTLLFVMGRKGIGRETIFPEKSVESLKEATQKVREELK